MHRRLLFAGFTLSLFLGTAVAAAAQSEESPVNEPGKNGAHFHHVDTPAGCKAVGAVAFERTDRGLHQGASKSGTNRGPEHGACPRP